MKNIIILCDGTGNEISENISNVLKLYRCLRKTDKTEPRQMVFYDPGVGTLARPDPWHKLRQDFNAILGLATGYGLDDKVLAVLPVPGPAITRTGDQIYLFGFSRGAYTVRVLAGLIHKVGLLSPEQVNLAGSGLTAYKQFSSRRPAEVSASTCKRSPMPATTTGRWPPQGRPRGAVRAHHLDALAAHSLRRRLGYGRERDRAAAGSVLLAEPGGARVHPAEPEREDVPAGDLDRRAALHVPPEEMGRAADLQA